MEDNLRRHLSTKVEINADKDHKGTTTIHFGSNDELERLMEMRNYE